MELTAATISAKVGKFLEDEYCFDSVKKYFWVDNQIILGYLQNEARRFQVFVANRVQQIKNISNLESWHYVPTNSNPSDIASRGCSVDELLNSNWFRGLDFLWTENISDFIKKNKPREQNIKVELSKDMKKSSVFDTVVVPNQTNEDYLIDRLNIFSSWHRAKLAIANCQLYMEKLKGGKIEMPTLSNIRKAKITIIKSLQSKYFKDEIVRFSAIGADTRVVKRSSKLYRLDPFLDEVGILRVGGRIKKAALAKEISHPIILPSHGHVVELVVRSFHIATNHMGRGGTLNTIRQHGFWLIGGTSVVSKHIHRCVTCNKLRGKLCTQKMADLPADRMAMEPPFSFCGVDYFGPFYIKEKRSMLKRYGVLFTCLSSRAVHLESANSLDTDSFINALRRFLARRGPIQLLRSDQGSNLIGANNELLESLKSMNHKNISGFLLKENCDWVQFKYNVPSASFMGGCWERQIRSVRAVLETLLRDFGSQLDDECLRTFLVETENIINSRPLSVENLTDSDALEPLTPNHLIKMKPQILLPPPGNFVAQDIYVRKRWRRVQYMANQFWIRWRKEFLHHLQQRNKWTKPSRNLQIVDIVIISDEIIHQREWKLGRVVHVYESDDELVRKVRVQVGTSQLDKLGKRQGNSSFVDRPIHKLVLILPVKKGREECYQI